MISETYDYITYSDKTFYLFQSEGQQGTVLKGVLFSPMDNQDAWNLAFGDMINGDLNDSVISNNYDFIKLFGTIAKIAFEFSNHFPDRIIHIIPVDEKRKKLYNHIFRRNYEDINLVFYIKGILNDAEEDYSPENFYDNFKIEV